MKTGMPRLDLILLKIIAIIIFSWILVHLLAVFGVLLAFVYPILWLLVPKQVFCLLCHADIKGSYCHFCRRPIEKSAGISSPKDLRSAIYNGFLILVFTAVSIGLVFGESQLLSSVGFPPTPKTASFIIPPKGQYRLGEIFPMKIEIDNIKNPINAVQADIGFEPQKLEVVDVSTQDSFADIFIQKEINNDGGWVRLTGGLPNPGFYGTHGVFGTVYFTGKTPGLIKIEFLPSSMILANDGKGTNILKDLPSVSYLILPEKISKEEEEIQKKLISQATVSGESTDNIQMKFYDEGSVLGTSIEKEIKKEQQLNPVKTTLDILEKTDRFILSQWEKAFSIFK